MTTVKTLFSCAATGLCILSLALMPALIAADGSQTNLTVEVLIFSGRPNPGWRLQDAAGLQALKAKLEALPEAFKEEPAEWSRLGFAGFRIRGAETMGLPAEIRIYQGVIKTGQGKEARYLKDSEGLEQGLIAEARMQPLPPPVKEALTNYESARRATK